MKGLSQLSATALVFLLVASIFSFLIFIGYKELASLPPVFLTAFCLYLLEVLRIHYQKPKIYVSKVDYYVFENSIRIFAKVENKGRSVARYVKPLLTIENENLSQSVYAERSDLGKKWLPCVKNDRHCEICGEDGRGFLCPYPFEVSRNYLCWAVAEVDAGSGLYHKPYRHVTNIAPNDSQEVIIGDMYRDEEEKTSVIKFASEYGIDWKPRICYKIDLKKGATIQFTLGFVGEGFDLTEEKIGLKVTKDELKVVFKGSEILIREFKDIKSSPVSLRARVF